MSLANSYSFTDYLNDLRTIRQCVATITQLAADTIPFAGGKLAWDTAFKLFKAADERMTRFENTPPGSMAIQDSADTSF